MKTSDGTDIWSGTMFCLNIIVVLGLILPVMAEPISQQIIIIVREQAWQRLSFQTKRDAVIDGWAESSQVGLSIVREFGTHGWVIKLKKNCQQNNFPNLLKRLSKIRMLKVSKKILVE